MPSSDQKNRPAQDAGYATAEAAVVLPVLVLFAGVLIWGLMAAAAQIQCVDAARAGARAAARSEPRSTALAAARSAAPRGAEIGIRREDGLVRVTVTAQTPGPSGLGLTLRSEAVASDEALTDPVRDPGASQSQSGPEPEPESGPEPEPESGPGPGPASASGEREPGPGPSASGGSS